MFVTFFAAILDYILYSILGMRPSPSHFSQILFALIMISKKRKNEGAEDFSLALSYYYKVLVVTSNLWSLISVGHRMNVGYVFV